MGAKTEKEGKEEREVPFGRSVLAKMLIDLLSLQVRPRDSRALNLDPMGEPQEGREGWRDENQVMLSLPLSPSRFLRPFLFFMLSLPVAKSIFLYSWRRLALSHRIK